MKRRRVLSFAFGLLAAGLYLASGTYSVDSDENAVVFLLGGVAEPDVGPGVHWAAPWPFGRVILARTRTNTTMLIGLPLEEDKLSEIDSDVSGPRDLWMTAGASIVAARIDVQYAITSLTDYSLSAADPQALVRAAAEQALNRFLLALDVDDVLTTQRQRLRQEVRQALQARLDSLAAGVRIQSINVALLSPPEEGGVAAAFQDVQNASADRQKLLQRARATEAHLVNSARSRAQQIRNDALATKTERVSLAGAEADRFRAFAEAYDRAPEVAQRRAYIDSISRALQKSKTYILPRSGPGADGKILLSE